MFKNIVILYFVVLPLFVTAQTADFTFQSTDGLFCNPTTIRFTQTCTGNPIGFVWAFGNGSRGYSGNVTTTYSTSGTFTVKLIAIYSQTKVEVTKTITIHPAITSSIVADRNYICTPGVINFSAVSTGSIIGYTWDFGDNSPIQKTVQKDTVHNYTNYGNFQAALKAIDSNGCTGVANIPIDVIKPPIDGTALPSLGCIPAAVNFTASTKVPANDIVTNYTWNFGDGSPVLSTASNAITRPYNAVGNYSPTLDIITKNGCTNSYNFTPLAFGTPPTNHVAYPEKTVICGSDTSVFVSKAINANGYYWDFGDGNTFSATDTVVRHKFSTLGVKTITVTPNFNGCVGIPISFQVSVVGVIAGYNYSNTCTGRKTYAFTNNSQGNLTSVIWNFGDSSAPVSTTNATHTFPPSGQFITSLRVTDSVIGCSDTYSQTLFTANPVLVNPDSSICRNTNTSFSIANNYSMGSAFYWWNVTGVIVGPTNNPALNIKAGTLGNFSNYVIINYGPQSCPDTVRLKHPILVKGPDLKFSAPDSSCHRTIFSVRNSSRPFFATDSVRLWYWNFGNSGFNDTTYQPVPFRYEDPGTYDVTLTAIDMNGCKDSLTMVADVVSNPFLLVIPEADTLCQGEADTLRAFSDATLLWSPASAVACVNCDSVIVKPSVTTKYFITATYPFNCVTRDSVTIKVHPIFTATTPSANLLMCRNDQVQLEVFPTSNRVIWSPPAGLSNPTIFNPVASPLQTTTYTAAVTDSAGCFTSNVSINVVVKSLPTVDAGPDLTVPHNSTFSLSPVYSNNARKYLWTPAALLNCSDCARPTGTAVNSETYNIQVISDSGCVANDNVKVFVECKSSNIFMPTAFTPNNDDLNDSYYPITRGIKSIISFRIFNRQGQLMHEVRDAPANNRLFAWNGEFKGQYQPAAAYVFVLEALCDSDARIVKTGSVMLLR